MVPRLLLLPLLAALALFLGSAIVAAKPEKVAKNTHEGTFVSAKAHEFTMKVKDKEHTHTLAKGAKVLDADGKECKITDIKSGARIRVTTKEGDKTVATKVEVLKKA
jgi:hypothetical protein